MKKAISLVLAVLALVFVSSCGNAAKEPSAAMKAKILNAMMTAPANSSMQKSAQSKAAVEVSLPGTSGGSVAVVMDMDATPITMKMTYKDYAIEVENETYVANGSANIAMTMNNDGTEMSIHEYGSLTISGEYKFTSEFDINCSTKTVIDQNANTITMTISMTGTIDGQNISETITETTQLPSYQL